MKLKYLTIGLIAGMCAGGAAEAATLSQNAVTITNGAGTYLNSDSFATFGIVEIDLSGMTPLNSTTTVKIVHAGVTSTVASVVSTDGTGQWLAPSSTTNVSSFAGPQWFLTNTPVTAGAGTIAVATGNVIRTINYVSMVPPTSVATATVAQVGYTNAYVVTCVGGFGTSGELSLPAVSASTITVATGTNAGKAFAAVAPFGATVTQTTTTYAGTTYILSPADKVLFSGAGTNLTGAAANINGSSSN